jgi:hypothetical protein
MRAATPADQPLLRDEALRADGVARPEKVRVVSSKVTGNDASVDLAFTVAGAEQKMTLSLTATGADKKLGVFPGWKVASSLGGITATSSNDGRADIAGVAVRQDGWLAVFPGRYPVHADDLGGMLAVDAPTVDVTDGRREAHIGVRLSDKGRTAVLDAVNKRIDECVQMTTVDVSDCPYDPSNYVYGTASNAAYRLINRPAVELTWRNGGVVELDGTYDGRVEYGADVDWLGSVRRETGEIRFNVQGTATIASSGVSLDLH